MQEISVLKYADRNIFAVNEAGQYEWMTYKEFGQNVDHLRGGLASLGIEPKDRVAIIADNSPKWAISCYASMGLGAAFVPMYTNQSLDDWGFKIVDSEAKVLMVQDGKIYDKVKHLVDTIPSLEHIVDLSNSSDSVTNYESLLNIGATEPSPSFKPHHDDVMGFIYTSGTTGNPKGVLLTHGNISFLLKTLPEMVDISDELSLSFLPWAHIFGQLAELHSLIRLGNSTAFADSPKTIVENLSQVNPTILFSAPIVFNRIYDKTIAGIENSGFLKRYLFDCWYETAQKKRIGESLGWKAHVASMVEDSISKSIGEKLGGKLKYAVSGGSKLDQTVAEFIDDLGITVLEGYGLSETAGIISLNTLTDRKIGSVGKPFPGVHIVIDKSKSNSNEGNEGEIVVYGPNIMQGYNKLPEVTASEMTEDGGFRTGDIGYLDDDGFLFITGRIKEIFKLNNGKYVVPQVLEAEAKRNQYIKEAFLYGQDKEYTVIVVCADMNQVENYASEHGIDLKGEELLQTPLIKDLFQAQFECFRDKSTLVDKPLNYAVLADDWEEIEDLYTPTLKLKRNEVEKRYFDLLQSLYH